MGLKDLNYMNAKKEDIGAMKGYTLDLAFGDDENNFECRVNENNHCCEKKFYLYMEGTEYGGIIDDIGVDTNVGDIIYYGRTWHGILNSKILEPNAGEDHLIVEGEANSVLASLIDRMDLSDLFIVSTEDSGIKVPIYKMNRYISGYNGIRKMLKASGAKLNISVNKDGFAVLSAKPLIDYSKDEQFEQDKIAFKIRQKGNLLNHVICLGRGDLKDREVIHIYADENGNIVENQVFTGSEEVTAKYENPNVTDSEELKQGGIDMIKAAWSSDELDFDFMDDEISYDIGDIVGGVEKVTGVEVVTEITKKIVKISKGIITVSYPYNKTPSGGNIYNSGYSDSGDGESGYVVPKTVVLTLAEYNILVASDQIDESCIYIVIEEEK